MLGHDQGADTAHVRRREAVPGREDLAASEPRDLDPDAAREELDRRGGGVKERQRGGPLVAADPDHGGETPGGALDGHVVRRGDEHRALEVRGVSELVQQSRELALRGREAHVDHVEALLHRPAQAAEEHRAAALEPGAEHAGAVQLALRRNRPNDPGARGAVATEVALGVRLDLGLVLVPDAVEGDGTVDLAHERVAGLDAAVEDADADALAGRAPDRPVACYALRPLDADRDAIAGAGRKAPRR